jgi:hypothetical protein
MDPPDASPFHNPNGKLVDAYAVCPRDCDVLLVLQLMTRSELAIPHHCPAGCGANLDVVPTREIIVV